MSAKARSLVPHFGESGSIITDQIDEPLVPISGNHNPESDYLSPQLRYLEAGNEAPPVLPNFDFPTPQLW